MARLPEDYKKISSKEVLAMVNVEWQINGDLPFLLALKVCAEEQIISYKGYSTLIF